MIESILSSSGPFIITLREALEAAIIIGIITAYLSKTGKDGLKKYLWAGAVTGIIASLLLGIVLALFYVKLEGAAENIFEGTSSILATVVLTYMIFWMAKNSHKIKEEMHAKIGSKIASGSLFGIVVISFIVVFREGVETVLFLISVAAIDTAAAIIGAVAGIAAVIIISFMMFEKLYSINIKKFFRCTSIILLIFAAGIFGYGIHEYIESADHYNIELGFLGQHAYDINPDDGTSIFHENGAVGSILKALIGYDGNPEWLRVIAYVSYWVVIGLYLIRTYASNHKTSRTVKRNR